jgi:hypothetical protein
LDQGSRIKDQGSKEGTICDDPKPDASQDSKPKEPKPKKRTEETWLTDYGVAWEEVFGGSMPYPKFAAELKKLEAKHTRPVVLERWQTYCEANRGRGEFASAAKFSQTFGQWSGDPAFSPSANSDPRGNIAAAENYLAKKNGVPSGEILYVDPK